MLALLRSNLRNSCLSDHADTIELLRWLRTFKT